MRLAGLYDIHGNLPALEAVLAEVEAERPDVVIVGGDVVAGPMPVDVLERLEALEIPTRWVRGNADREVLAYFDEPGRDMGERWRASGDAWVARHLTGTHRDRLAGFEMTVEVGGVLFCHGSPRRDDEIIASVTPDERLRPMLAGVTARTVVCGHTHHQFDRVVDGIRVFNAGSVGMPYQGDAAAFWISFDPQPRLRRTAYDIEAALARLRASGFPDVEETCLRESLVEPVSAQWVAEFFERRAREEDAGITPSSPSG